MCSKVANRRRGGGGVKSDLRETPIRATTQEDINALLVDEYEVNNSRPPEPENKPITRGDTYRKIYKYVWNCSGIQSGYDITVI